MFSGTDSVRLHAGRDGEMNSASRRKLFLQRSYFYFESLAWGVLELCPTFVRSLVFRAAFQKFGAVSWIDYGCYVRYPWKVSIGTMTSINRGCRFYPAFASGKGPQIVIGNNVALGPGVVLCTAGHDYTTLTLEDTRSAIVIGDRAWIGAHAIILQGVEIGEGSVVGAGSVVTRNVPAWTVVAGNPARHLKQRTIT